MPSSPEARLLLCGLNFQTCRPLPAAVNGQRRGAATYAFVQAIKRHRETWGFEILYGQLLQAMHDELRRSVFRDQHPTLSASMDFDLADRRHKFSL